ncbi:glutathione S-transferase N-terminal domain-containing protein [Phenylobacterium sp. LjRoot225]|uniref:glutathione S-transferase family protein n=1 Tax=Phenylobacterium sp. LjRoot225 TaxID=3342285 RepID=UPI003ED087A7
MPIRLYYFPTPNGRKVSIALEEMGLDYEIERIDILRDEQSRPDFLAISPNGRIPGLVDEDAHGERVVIFESGAILQYLGRKTGRFYPTGEARRSWVDAWLFWQMAGLGPMTGQVTWFRRASAKPGRDPRDCSFALHRYEKEMRRLYGVLETQLAGRDFICDDYSIADMACWPWVAQHHDYLGRLDQFPNIQAWSDRIQTRPAVLRAMVVGLEGLP